MVKQQNGNYTTITSDSITSDAVITDSITSDAVSVNNTLRLPVSYIGDVEPGSIQFNSDTNTAQIYKTGIGWSNIGNSVLAETVPELVSGVSDPVTVATLNNLFTTTVDVADSTALTNALTAAVENTRIRFTADIVLTVALTIPDKSLRIDLNTFTLTVPVLGSSSIICQQNQKIIYFSNGTIKYDATGTTNANSVIISAGNCQLYIIDTIIEHAEVAVRINASTAKVQFYSLNTIYTFVKARSSINNSYRPISYGGSSDEESYVYIRNCTFDSTDSYLLPTDVGTFIRGCVNITGSGGITAFKGSCTITGCTINPGHRVQSIFYNDETKTVNGTLKLMIDNNIIGDAGVREQIIISIGNNTLNNYSSIYLLENVMERADSNKGLIYVDSVNGGSCDVYIAGNTIPLLKPVDPVLYPSNYSMESNTATIITLVPHPFTVGYTITLVVDSNSTINGTYLIQSIINEFTFTINVVSSSTLTGTVIVVDNFASSQRKVISVDGYVRGPTTMQRCYLQNYKL